MRIFVKILKAKTFEGWSAVLKKCSPFHELSFILLLSLDSLHASKQRSNPNFTSTRGACSSKANDFSRDIWSNKSQHATSGNYSGVEMKPKEIYKGTTTTKLDSLSLTAFCCHGSRRTGLLHLICGPPLRHKSRRCQEFRAPKGCCTYRASQMRRDIFWV